jgi:hypothetical protein
MKGSPVRVRASAWEEAPAKAGVSSFHDRYLAVVCDEGWTVEAG